MSHGTVNNSNSYKAAEPLRMDSALKDCDTKSNDIKVVKGFISASHVTLFFWFYLLHTDLAKSHYSYP